MDPTKADTLSILEKQSKSLGLMLFGVTRLKEEADFARYLTWLEKGYHAGMTYLSNHLDIRKDPRKLLPGAQSVLVIGLPYYQGDKLALHSTKTPRIAQYARLKDYHRILRKKCEILASTLRELNPGNIENRVVVDSAPILERAVAARASGGFIGKNTCFIHSKYGSWWLLAEILTTLDFGVEEKKYISPDQRTPDGGCGSCKRCQVFCPTGALDEDYILNANRCLSYWTIEHRGTIPEEFWPWLSDYYFGCDICQLVCPYNRKIMPNVDQNIVHFKVMPSLFEVAVMDQKTYEALFAGTPMTRAKRSGLKRNALIAMAVTKDPLLNKALDLSMIEENELVVKETVAQIKSWLEKKK